MIAKLLALFSGVGWLQYLVAGAVVGIVVGGLWRIDHAWQVYKLEAEISAHKATRGELAVAVTEGLRWRATAVEKDAGIAALQGAVRDCLKREQETVENIQEREGVMKEDTPENKGKSDAVRKKAADRLNRPL